MPTLLFILRLLDSEDVLRFSATLLPPYLRPSSGFLTGLSYQDRITALRACLLVYSVTRGHLVPHELQLEAALAAENGKETFVIARTGWGKTLCIAIPLLLHPDRISVTISPLKRLQMMQVSDFLKKFGIATVAVNEDTPNCPLLWSAIAEGRIPHLIVQPEQFALHHGHLPRLARLLHDHKFVSRVARVSVDECHNIRQVGSTINGRKAFRPAYGALPQLRLKLSKSTAWTFLSATVPDYIYNHIHQTLAIGPSPTIIRVSINRPNLIYATHTLVGGRNNMHNLDLIIPPDFHPPMRLPKLVIFHGNKAETAIARQHIDSRLPQELQNLGIVRHYHADMSREYLEDVYSSFADPDGTTLILNATAGAGEGLDVKGIDGVIIYGIVSDVTTKSQWDGRAGRSTNAEAFCVHMIEPWVDAVDLTELQIDPNDPDHPLADVALTKKNPTKQERTGRASIHHAKSPECARVLNAQYYQDDSPEALHYTGRWCCDSDSHPNNTFALERLFLGPVHTEKPAVPPIKRPRATYRPTKERPELEELLIEWRTQMHSRLTLRALRPPTFILDSSAIRQLTMARASSITSAESITSLLKQSPEWEYMWAESLFKLISTYSPTMDDSDEESEEDEPPRKRRK
ncbi:P-loop containing nucleoside triphosphate hydrolase protein [Mycena latifolia]|nr:P-loop containing nucleoside triphosphate hydrolase protein [Mycena latifolia]